MLQPLADRESVFDLARLNDKHDGRATWDTLMSNIYLAAAAGEDEVVKRLVRSGANIWAPDSVSKSHAELNLPEVCFWICRRFVFAGRINAAFYRDIF